MKTRGTVFSDNKIKTLASLIQSPHLREILGGKIFWTEVNLKRRVEQSRKKE